MATKRDDGARVGDSIEMRAIHGQAPRRGEIVEVLGSADRPHYRVRWDEQHESVVYPDDGVLVIPAAARATD